LGISSTGRKRGVFAKDVIRNFKKNMARLLELYKKEIAGKLQKELGVKNLMAVPTLQKIVVTLGFSSNKDDKAFIEETKNELSAICGQRPALRTAKKAIAGFKLRKGDPVGYLVTLRGGRMWDFYDKLVNVVLPKLRDFHGVSKKSFDGKGNYTMGMKEQTIFPEIDPNKTTKIRGLKITLVTTAKNDVEGMALLRMLGMPFEK